MKIGAKVAVHLGLHYHTTELRKHPAIVYVRTNMRCVLLILNTSVNDTLSGIKLNFRNKSMLPDLDSSYNSKKYLHVNRVKQIKCYKMGTVLWQLRWYFKTLACKNKLITYLMKLHYT